MATADDLARGRDSFDRQAWGGAFAQLSAADRRIALAPDDLERLATAAYLLGNDADSTAIWARAYHDRLDQGEVDRAARCAIWLAFVLMLTGATARCGAGWPGPSGFSTTAGPIVSSRVIASYRARSSTSTRVTMRQRTPRSPGPRRSENGSVTRTLWLLRVSVGARR
jgi:hypothetical protein